MALENGVPSADTFERVWTRLDNKEFKKSFMQWAGSIRKKIKGEVISIDGKTSRGSEDEDHKAIHMVSAWLHDQRLVLGQIAVEEKSNEITAVPELVKMLEIADCIITAFSAFRFFPSSIPLSSLAPTVLTLCESMIA